MAFLLNISKNNRHSSIFRALSSQLIFFSHGEDRFLLTFMNFFYACTGLRKCYLKRSYDPNFVPSSLFPSHKFFPQGIFLCFT